MSSGMIGGILGSVIGLMGGIVGTYFSIKNTNGSKERVFMIKVSIFFWIGLTIFLLLMFLLPNPYRYFLWIPYGILLPIVIIKSNKTQSRIRQEELKNKNHITRQSTGLL